MDDYKFYKTCDGGVLPCDNCGSPVPLCKHRKPPHRKFSNDRNDPYNYELLCELCAGSALTDDPDMSRHVIGQSVASMLNTVLLKLGVYDDIRDNTP